MSACPASSFANSGSFAVSRRSNLVFSSTRTRPFVPSSSRRRSATGAIEYAGSGPFGRPRCEHTITSAAPRSSSNRSVGSAAPIRVSSATRPSSNGTLRSARTSTRLPSTSASRTDRGSFTSRSRGYGLDRERLPDHRDQVDEPAAVAPLVVVPPEDLRQRLVRHRQLAVEDARVGRVDDVGRDERIFAELQVLAERPPGRLAIGADHLVARNVPRQPNDEVGD